VGGVVTYLFGRWLERRNPPRNLVDPTTGKEVVVQSRNDLFFIPVTVWGLIGIVGGAIMAVAGAFGFEL
jgi:membrane protein YqaA with SNARE-associated domain